MGRNLVGRMARLAAIALGVVGLAQAAAAQSAVFTGTVTSVGRPLGGATVAIPELGVGTLAGADGKYTFSVDVSRFGGRTVQILVRAIGYKPKRMPVTIAAGRVEKNYELERDVLNLEQVVVTGVSDETSQKKTAFSVAVVDQQAIKDVPAPTPVGALAGKIAGASVVTNSGRPGDEPSIRLRSPTSLGGRQDPLIIVDGTITRLGLADLNSEDIEKVEVIKGAAASSLYGSDAANGVIQIFTKRGSGLGDGQSSFTFRNEFGSSALAKTVGLNTSTAFVLDPSNTTGLSKGFKLVNGNRVSDTSDVSKYTYPFIYDPLKATFRSSDVMTNYIGYSGRRGRTNFYTSFQNTKETGILNLLNGFQRQNFRVNVDQGVSDELSFSVGAFYGRSTSDQPPASDNIFFGIRFIEPNIDITAPAADGTPYNPIIRQPPSSGNLNNPLYRLSKRKVTDDRTRFTGNAKLTWKPLAWLTGEAAFNYDQSGTNYKSYFAPGFTGSTGAVGSGSIFQQMVQSQTYNMSANLTSVRRFGNWLTNTTKLAWVYEDQSANTFNANAPKLTVPGVTEFGAAAQDPTNPNVPGSQTITIRNNNLFAITTFDIKDRYIVDGLIRRDESSLFGKQNRSANFFRASAAYRVSEDIRIPGVDEFKLRASYGTAGLRPPFQAQYETWAVVSGSPTKQTLGNNLLKPARSAETEAGFNLAFLRNFNVDYSYSRRITKDQILEVPLSSAAGYRTQWTNAATLDGYTHELAIGAVLYSGRDAFWRVNLVGDRTRSRITQLSVAPYLAGPDAGDGNTRIFRVAAGQKFGVIYGSTWIQTADQLANTIQSGKLAGPATNYVRNELGYYVLASAKGTSAERPLKYFDKNGNALQEIGDVNPDFTAGLTNTMQWKGLNITSVFVWTKGGNIYNYTRQWPFNELRDAAFDQRNVPAGQQKPQGFFQAFYNNFDPNSYFVENGTYLRLRELAVNYQLPRGFTKAIGLKSFETARIGLVGRNLWTSTKYSGYDPDVTGPGGGNPFAYRVDYFTYPPFRTITGMIELGF